MRASSAAVLGCRLAAGAAAVVVVVVVIVLSVHGTRGGGVEALRSQHALFFLSLSCDLLQLCVS